MLRNTDDVVHLRISKDSNNFRGEHKTLLNLLIALLMSCKNSTHVYGQILFRRDIRLHAFQEYVHFIS